MPGGRRLLALAVGVVLATMLASPAAAHTGLDASDPVDGSTVDGPLATVVLDFTGTPTAIDDGIVIADATGTRIEPVQIVQEGLRITARFEPPLGAGTYALSWVVRSSDTHTVDGSFGFTVQASAATTGPASTIVASTTPATGSTAVGTEAAPPATTAPAADDSLDDREDPAAPAPDAAAGGPAPPTIAPPAVAAELEAGRSVARIGRLALVPAAVVGVGTLAFAASALAGRRSDLFALLRIVQWLAVAVVVGAVLELVGMRAAFDDYGELLAGSSGRAAVVRGAAGLLLAVGIGLAVGRTDSQARSLGAAVADDLVRPSEAPASEARWRPTGRDAPMLVAVALLVASFGFDGHTASEGPRAVHALASITHVVAAAVWAGGLVALATVLWRRHRDGVERRAMEMVLRFSTIAIAALLAASAAGVAMAWLIESDLGAYASTEWGRLLLFKLGLVAMAAGLGTYNHFRLLPALRATPDDPAVLERTRRTVTAEAAVLVGAAIVTAVLVGASTI